jgi:thiol-disulfide isomerase/thioredoxin
MRRAALFGLALAACARPAAKTAPNRAETIVHGHVFDEAGQPLPLAHVHGPDERRQPVGRDGSFSVSWVWGTKPFDTLLVTGAAHRSELVAIAREDRDVEVTVRLGRPAPQGEIHAGVVLYSGPDPKPKMMTRDWDGTTFSAVVEAPDGRYPYQIVGVFDDGLNGEPTDGWELTEDGHRYRPQILIKGGSARITLDPRKLHASSSSIAFAHPGSTSAALTAIDLRVSHAHQSFSDAIDALIHAKDGPVADLSDRANRAEAAEWTALRRELAAQAQKGTPALVRHRAAIAYFDGPAIESPTADERAIAKRILGEVAPEDEAWALSKSLANVLRAVADTPQSLAYEKAFIAKQADATAVCVFLLDRLREEKDPHAIRELFGELQKPRCANMPEREEAAAYDPDRPLAPGKSIQFDVKSLTTAGRITPKDLAGTVYLIDVWGTWCVPCVAELPRIHELYAKFGGAPANGRTKRFEVLSIAAEHDADAVTKFRADESHPMPWKHGIADPESFLEKFAGPGYGFPTYVLVDENGKIIVASPQLRPSELPQLLERALR